MQREWWVHRSGCGAWFLAERDTRTNEVHWTATPETGTRDPPRPAPGERIDRARTVTFTFDGKPVEAFAGDTIASALYAGGRRIFSRSFKYHRPRGEMCWAGQCANSLVQVDGAPGIRACERGRARRAWSSSTRTPGRRSTSTSCA